MKLILSIVVSLSSLAYAEVKPPGAIIPKECGVNTLEPSSNAPTQVCVYSVQGYTDVVLVGVRVTGGVKYFRVMNPYQPTWYASQVRVSQSGSYVIFESNDSEFVISFDKNGTVLSGPQFKVQLSPMAVSY